MDLFVGLDVGTQASKAVVYCSKTKRVVSRGVSAYDVLKSDVPTRAEQHPQTWIDSSTEALQSALSYVDRSKVRGIGVSGQQHGLVTLDSRGKVIRNAKLWCDTESAEEASELSEAFNFTTPPGFTVSKILWLKRNEPQNFEKLATVLLPHDYVNYHLSGELATECGDASGTGYFNLESRSYDSTRLEAVDGRLVSCVPQIVGPSEVLGTLRKEVAETLGLRDDVVISPGSGDNMASALGSGAVREGIFVISLGTSGTLFGMSEKPVLDPGGTVAPFCDATGKYLPLLCTQNCTTVAEEVRHAFGSFDHGALTELAAAEAPGCSGMTFLPYLTGERSPNWPNASGVLYGIRPGLLRPGVQYRAALEGATYCLKEGFEVIRKFGMSASEFRVVGGGSKNRLWRHIIADTFQCMLRFPVEAESGALGVALQAAAVYYKADVGEYISANQPELSEEVVEPDEKNRAAYAEAWERHVTLGQQLFS